MRPAFWKSLVLSGIVLMKHAIAIQAAPAEEYFGVCDASAAVPVGNERFVTASDEDNRLRVYHRGTQGLPLQILDLSHDLGLKKKSESDLEGAAELNGVVYWIGSHGRNNDGKRQPDREIFFGTKLGIEAGKVTCRMAGQPSHQLLEAMVAAPSLAFLNLRAASKLPPKEEGGLNIEGLAATPEGGLLIAFRNPIPGGKALLVPLQNPLETLSGQTPQFGRPIFLDLGGLGFRDILFRGGNYWIVAGSFDGAKDPRLFSWSGPGASPVEIRQSILHGLNPEGVFAYPNQPPNEFQILSDDGSRKIAGEKCKDCKKESLRRFRSLRITID